METDEKAQQNQKPPQKRRLRQLAELGDTVLKALALFIIIYHWFFQISVVKGDSMSPLFSSGDRLIIEKVTYGFQAVKPGDLVVFWYPRDISKEYLKRVIAVPFDTVCIERGKVRVNGKEVSFPNVIEQDSSTKDIKQSLRSAEYFVLGDNRPISSDSRDFGPVPQGYIKGRVFLRFWPLTKWKFF